MRRLWLIALSVLLACSTPACNTGATSTSEDRVPWIGQRFGASPEIQVFAQVSFGPEPGTSIPEPVFREPEFRAIAHIFIINVSDRVLDLKIPEDVNISTWWVERASDVATPRSKPHVSGDSGTDELRLLLGPARLMPRDFVVLEWHMEAMPGKCPDSLKLTFLVRWSDRGLARGGWYSFAFAPKGFEYWEDKSVVRPFLSGQHTP